MRRVKLSADGTDARVAEEAGRVLAQGGLVAFPTETVYGLGASAADPGAMRRLRELKRRPADKPFTAMIANRDQAPEYVGELSPMAARLARKGWPGPLTLVFELTDSQPTPMRQRLPAEHHAALYHAGTVGLRCPDLPFAREMVGRAGGPIVVSSANRAGEPAPTDADMAARGLDGLVDLVVDGGEVRYRKPSTIVKVIGDAFKILRAGVLDERAVRALASWSALFVCTGNTCRSPMAEGICRRLLADRMGVAPDELADRGIHVRSAGVGAGGGGPASSEAVEACRTRGIDIADHRASPLRIEHVNAADVVFCMTEAHRRSVVELVPLASDRASCLDDQADVDDPAGGTAAEYERTANRIEELLRKRLKELEI